MTALYAEIDGKHVSMAECDWVLWGSCGCPYGVTVARLSLTEDEAWKSFFDYKRDIARAQRRGDRLELMTHERYSREVCDRMRQRCTHTRAGSAS